MQQQALVELAVQEQLLLLTQHQPQELVVEVVEQMDQVLEVLVVLVVEELVV
tara:strand:- start:50 stop:205 length:156 start_codon:yes stop_codon:yes gene_type:complete